MKSIFLTAGALFLVLLSLASLRSLWVDQRLKTLTEPVPGTKTSERSGGVTLVRERQLEGLRSLSASPLHDAQVHVRIFTLLSRQASETTNPAERVRLYCEALSEIGAAVRAEPANAAYLINWANIRQILGRSVECSLPYTGGEFEAAAHAALLKDPSNVNVLFASAQLFDWAGKSEESSKNLNRTLLLATSLKPFQAEYVASRLRTPRDVEAILPARFPQIAAWSERVQIANPDLFRVATPSFEKLQLAAIDDSLAEFKSGKLPGENHRQRLMSLFASAATSSVRRRLDAELAAYAREQGDEVLTPYLMERGALFEAAVLDAAAGSDTRPLKSVLADWGGNPELCLDEFYASLGFYLPEGESPKLIELQGRRRDAQITPASLKILVSDDNQSWSELQGSVEISSVQFGDSKIVAIHPHSRYFKYWKINFSSSARTRSFCNSAQRMLTVYRSSPAEIS